MLLILIWLPWVSESNQLSQALRVRVLSSTLALSFWGLSLLLVARGQYSFLEFWFILRLRWMVSSLVPSWSTHRTSSPSSLGFRLQKKPDRDWRSCWLIPRSRVLEFQLSHRSFVNITSSVIDQVACSLICRTHDSIPPEVFERSYISLVLPTYSAVERDHAVGSFGIEVTLQPR